MSAPAPQKLTKKQKKGLAFRERKRNRGLTKDLNNSEPDDVPVMEDQDLAEAEPQAGRAQGQEEGEGLECVAVKPAPGIGDKRKGKSKGKDKEQGRDVVSLGQAKKRRRTDEGDADLALDVDGGELGPRRKKAQGSGQSTRQEKEEKDDCGEEGQAGSEEKPKKVEPKSGAKQRFILFVGNLKYTTSIQSVEAHFSSCDPPPTVRLLTPKPKQSAPDTRKPSTKSKGFAFLEFSHRNALQQALKLHGSDLDGRTINVELTAGGGGKSEGRLGKVRERNKELYGQRQKRLEVTVADSQPAQPTRNQRYSSTSGIDQPPLTKRTWTVGETEDDTHRGGRRHAKTGDKKSGRSKGRDWGTGVNAIPVG